MSNIKIDMNDSFEDYAQIQWYWFTLHLVMAARLSGLTREQKDREWDSFLKGLGVLDIPAKKKRRTIQEGTAR